MTDRETIARIIGENIAAQLDNVAIIDGRIKAHLEVLPIVDAILAAQQDGVREAVEKRVHITTTGYWTTVQFRTKEDASNFRDAVMQHRDPEQHGDDK